MTVDASRSLDGVARAWRFFSGQSGPAVAVTADEPVDEHQFAAILGAGADVVEFRLDRFAPAPDLSRLASHETALITLGTVRSGAEGGTWSRSETERRDLLLGCVVAFDVVDVELSSEFAQEIVERAKELGKPSIVSFHAFDRCPDFSELVEIEERARQLGADVVKIACSAQQESEFADLVRLTLATAERGVITLAMSSMGPVSRCTLPLLGSRLTYAHALGATVTSGQLSLAETVSLLRRFSPRFNERKIVELELLEDG